VFAWQANSLTASLENNTVNRLKIVGVMGSGTDDFKELAQAAGQAVAESGHHLLTGAGAGVMLAAAQAFVQSSNRKGLSLGIVRAKSLPTLNGSSRAWEARTPINDYIELPIKTHLPESGETGQDFYSRNHINVLTSDAVVVLPGEAGTKTELDLSMQYSRPTILFIGQHRLHRLTAADLQKQHAGRLQIAKDKMELSTCLRRILDA
jgi:uncharacterized protein (TIGR00725 family)